MAKQPTLLQMNILDMWAKGTKAADIAAELQCSESTVHKAKADPELKQYYYEACNKAIEELVPLAIQRLSKLIKDDKQQGTVAIAAVREILDRSKIKELTEALNANVEIIVKYE